MNGETRFSSPQLHPALTTSHQTPLRVFTSRRAHIIHAVMKQSRLFYTLNRQVISSSNSRGYLVITSSTPLALSKPPIAQACLQARFVYAARKF